MLQEFIKAFLLIFVSEMGDKTQVLLLTCAARYSIIHVLWGIFFGVALNHGLAILIGMYLSNLISSELLHIATGIIFIIFGISAFREENEDMEKTILKCGPVLTVAGTFFLGELGDKTQLTAMTIAMESDYPMIILAGSIAGMLAVGFMGIIIGSALTKIVPSYIIKSLSGLIFIIFGSVKLHTLKIFVNKPINQGIYTTVAIFLIAYLIKNLTYRRIN